MTRDAGRIELRWLPLGAGGWYVRANGRLYEAVQAIRERRRPLDLYHSALVVELPEGRFVVENCWPIPDGDGARVRDVAVEGAVASERIARFRMFRYEVRCWRDGTIADAGAAVASPQVVSRWRRLLELVGELPRPVWGRDELGTGEMWNSNSVIAWLRAPGWAAGVAVARRQQGCPAGEQRLPEPAHAGSHGPA
jgi:hypothetical protein